MSVEIEAGWRRTDTELSFRTSEPVFLSMHQTTEIEIKSHVFSDRRGEYVTISYKNDDGDKIEVTAFGKVGLRDSITQISEEFLEPHIGRGEAA